MSEKGCERCAELEKVIEELGSEIARLRDEIAKLKATIGRLEDELSQTRMRLVAGDTVADEGEEVDGIRVLAREVPMAPAGELWTMADVLRGRVGSGVVVLGSRGDGKVSLIVAVTEDVTGRVGAGEVVRELAPMVGGGGGGRPDFAQAGGRDPEALDRTLEAAPGVVRKLLG